MADVWLDAIAANPTTGVVPGMCDGPTRVAVASALLSRSVTAGELWEAAAAAIEDAAGRPWWEAVRLVGVAQSARQLLGMLTLDGVHAHAVTFGAWCDAALVTVLRNVDEKKRTQFEVDFMMPPGGSIDDLQGFDAVEW
jgi:hypothetical protein